MVNRAESLSNLGGFPDITAWRAIRNVERNNVVSYTPVETPKPINRIPELNGELSTLWQRKNRGEISSKEYRKQQQELANKLHEAEILAGHMPIRINKPDR